MEPIPYHDFIKHITVEELNKKIKELKTELRVLKRFYFIKYLYQNNTVKDSCDFVGVCEATGYNWLKLWNKKGLDGLYPHFAGGKPSKITDKQKEELKTELMKKNSWTTKEVIILVFEMFNVKYSAVQMIRILKSFGMYHGKPYLKDYRRPKNAEEILKKD